MIGHFLRIYFTALEQPHRLKLKLQSTDAGTDISKLD